MGRLEISRDARLKKLGAVGPLLAASLVRRMVRCGSPTCRCASGEKHETWCLTFKGEDNKTKTVHVPKAMVEEVRQWVAEHKRVKALLAEISSFGMKIIKSHVPRQRAAKRGVGGRKCPSQN